MAVFPENAPYLTLETCMSVYVWAANQMVTVYAVVKKIYNPTVNPSDGRFLAAHAVNFTHFTLPEALSDNTPSQTLGCMYPHK